jgi:hypothetical protein
MRSEDDVGFEVGTAGITKPLSLEFLEWDKFCGSGGRRKRSIVVLMGTF